MATISVTTAVRNELRQLKAKWGDTYAESLKRILHRFGWYSDVQDAIWELTALERDVLLVVATHPNDPRSDSEGSAGTAEQTDMSGGVGRDDIVSQLDARYAGIIDTKDVAFAAEALVETGHLTVVGEDRWASTEQGRRAYDRHICWIGEQFADARPRDDGTKLEVVEKQVERPLESFGSENGAAGSADGNGTVSGADDGADLPEAGGK